MVFGMHIHKKQDIIANGDDVLLFILHAHVLRQILIEFALETDLLLLKTLDFSSIQCIALLLIKGKVVESKVRCFLLY